jgi:hypothetical protein
VAVGGQTSVRWRLSRSVVNSVGRASGEFTRNADYLRFSGTRREATCRARYPSYAPLLPRGVIQFSWEESEGSCDGIGELPGDAAIAHTSHR